MTDINEGLTNNYLVHGVFTILAGAPLIYFHFLFWIPFLIVAIALFMSSNGLLIDSENKQYKAYGNILGYKLGTWKPIENLFHATLILSIERAKTNQTYIMGERGQSRSKTYDILLTEEFGNSILMYEFMKYKDAIKALTVIEKEFLVKTTDAVANQLIKNKINPRR
ncbi:MAG: hypothetical protein AB8B74_02220 [Crocinitomicaceae bacterium]